MTDYLIDSDYVIDWLKGKTPAVHLLQSLVQDNLAISTITYGEVFEGIYYGRNRQQIERVFRQFLSGVTALPVTRLIAQRFGIVRGDLRQRGQTIGDPDVVIAATAQHHNRTLITQNTRHFSRILDLSLY